MISPEELLRSLRADAAASVKAGMSIAKASRKHRITKHMVDKGCLEANVIPMNRENTSLPIIAALLTSLDPTAVIAKDRGVSRQWVDFVLKEARKAGIPFPRRPTSNNL